MPQKHGRSILLQVSITASDNENGCDIVEGLDNLCGSNAATNGECEHVFR